MWRKTYELHSIVTLRQTPENGSLRLRAVTFSNLTSSIKATLRSCVGDSEAMIDITAASVKHRPAVLIWIQTLSSVSAAANTLHIPTFTFIETKDRKTILQQMDAADVRFPFGKCDIRSTGRILCLRWIRQKPCSVVTRTFRASDSVGVKLVATKRCLRSFLRHCPSWCPRSLTL